MKKVVSFVLAVAVIGVLLMMPAGADTTVTNCKHYGESVTALEDGFINILFSNGYRGFCIKYGLDEAAQSDAFTVDNMALAAHNTSGQNFANDLKVMFVDFFTELFTVDTEHLTYTIKDATSVQRIIWHFSDGYTYRVDRNFVNEVRSAAMARAEEIPDHGYTVKLNNTTTATFDFHVLRTPNSAQQNFWTYKVTLARFPAPQILTPEGDESVETALGESEELKITALYAEQYQWQVNTGSGFEDIDDATEPTYTTPVATEENKDFTYRCVVSNTAGSAESPVFSLKLPAPTTTTTTTTTAPTTTTTTTTTAPTTTTTTTTTAPTTTTTTTTTAPTTTTTTTTTAPTTTTTTTTTTTAPTTTTTTTTTTTESETTTSTESTLPPTTTTKPTTTTSMTPTGTTASAGETTSTSTDGTVPTAGEGATTATETGETEVTPPVAGEDSLPYRWMLLFAAIVGMAVLLCRRQTADA